MPRISMDNHLNESMFRDEEFIKVVEAITKDFQDNHTITRSLELYFIDQGYDEESSIDKAAPIAERYEYIMFGENVGRYNAMSREEKTVYRKAMEGK